MNSTTAKTKPSRLAELLTIIATNTAIVEQYLQENRLPSPSFVHDKANFDTTFPPAVQTARQIVIDASIELQELMHGPRALLQYHLFQDSTIYLEPIYRFNIAGRVPLDAPEGISYAELAQQINVDQAVLTRVLRGAITHRIFLEPTPGMIAHSAASRLIATQADVRDWIGFATQEVLPLSHRLGQTLQQFPSADEPSQAAGAVVNPRDENARMPFFARLFQEPDRARRFASGISFHQKGEAYDLRHLVDNYDWVGLPPGATVVDLGGSHGEAVMAISNKFPHLKFVVQDLPDTIHSAPSPPTGHDVTFMIHDFFQPQPVKGAAVYLYRWTVHNWPDKYALKMLRALIPAMVSGSKVLIMDGLMPPRGSVSNTFERKTRSLDLTMLLLANAKEREPEEWRRLYEEADPRFQFEGITSPEGSDMSLIVARWEG